MKWRFVQTAAVDPAARGDRLPDRLLGEMIRYVAAHEMGHVLGLKHNMRGSYAYPVDSLRSPSFTTVHGTTASVMDYARFNYVAQPGDLDRGVKLSPSVLGAYDCLAIEWGYGYRPDGRSEAVFARVAGNPEYMYANSLMGLPVSDPAAQSDILGDDVIRSSEYGIRNLKYMTANLIEWCRPLDRPYRSLSDRYEAVVKQFFKYLTNCASYVGGTYYIPLAEDDLSARYTNVDGDKIEESLRFVFLQLTGYAAWLADEDIYAIIGNRSELLLKEQVSLLSAVMKVVPKRVALSNGDLPALLGKISETIFANGRGVDLFSRSLQLEYVAGLIELSAPGPKMGDTSDNMVAAAAAYELSRIALRLKSRSGNPHFKSIYNLIKREQNV